MANTYHVSKSGNDHNEGSAQEPFLTIQRAADIAAADTRGSLPRVGEACLWRQRRFPAHYI